MRLQQDIWYFSIMVFLSQAWIQYFRWRLSFSPLGKEKQHWFCPFSKIAHFCTGFFIDQDFQFLWDCDKISRHRYLCSGKKTGNFYFCLFIATAVTAATDWPSKSYSWSVTDFPRPKSSASPLPFSWLTWNTRTILAPYPELYYIKSCCINSTL